MPKVDQATLCPPPKILLDANVAISSLSVMHPVSLRDCAHYCAIEVRPESPLLQLESEINPAAPCATALALTLI